MKECEPLWPQSTTYNIRNFFTTKLISYDWKNRGNNKCCCMPSNARFGGPYKGKGHVFYGQEPPSGQSTTTECGANYQQLSVMLLKLPNGELPVAVDHSQLLTLQSETVDSFGWPLHPTIHRAIPPEHVLHGANVGDKSPDLLQRMRHKANSLLLSSSGYEVLITSYCYNYR